MVCKDQSTIGDNQKGESMLAPDMVSKQLSHCESIFLFGTWDKYSFFEESINDHQNIIITEGLQHLSWPWHPTPA